MDGATLTPGIDLPQEQLTVEKGAEMALVTRLTSSLQWESGRLFAYVFHFLRKSAQIPPYVLGGRRIVGGHRIV